MNSAASRWYHIGLALGIADPTLEEIGAGQMPDPENCLTNMLRVWLKRSYDTDRQGMPSWQRLSQAINHPSGGNNPALAQDILRVWDFEQMRYTLP